MDFSPRSTNREVNMIVRFHWFQTTRNAANCRNRQPNRWRDKWTDWWRA